MKTTPAKMVASSERMAPGLICSTATHQLAELARGRSEESGGRAPEKGAEGDPDQDRDHKPQAWTIVHGIAEEVGDGLFPRKERPGSEAQPQEDPPHEGRHQAGADMG